MKRIVLTSLSFSFLLLWTVSCVTHVIGITLSDTSISLEEGDTKLLAFSIIPDNADNRNVFWSSSDNNVATVSEGGLVTAIGPGNAIITVTAEDNNSTANCKVAVTKKIYPVEKIAFENDEITFSAGDTITMSILIFPEAAANRPDLKYTWRAWYNKSIVIVENGIITGNIPGIDEVVVEVWDEKFHRRVEAACKVTVDYRIPEPVDLGLSVYWSSINLGAPKEAWYGPYYSWGEIDFKNTYGKGQYSYMTAGNGWTTSDEYIDIGNIITGTEYDAANIHLGNGWRLPLSKELQELVEQCTWEKETQYYLINGEQRDCIGYRITGPNGNSIFMSACALGGHVGDFLYWSGELSSDEIAYADCLCASEYTNNYCYFWRALRYEGNPIRPVKDK